MTNADLIAKVRDLRVTEEFKAIQARHGVVEHLALKLWKAGRCHGKEWPEIIDALGYDPRDRGGLTFR